VRRVSIIKDLKQRLHEILGTDEGNSLDPAGTEASNSFSPDPVYNLNPWSIQSAMISNIERVCSALVGGSINGRVLSGMQISHTSGGMFVLQPGYCITPDGKMISLTSSISSIYIPTNINSTTYVSLNYVLVAINGDNDTRGRKTSFLGGPTKTRNIVYDEMGAIIGGMVDSSPYREKFLSTGSSYSGGDGKALIATITINNGDIDIVSNTGGASGTFQQDGGSTVTVLNGMITQINS
jgi:hypothetical protein